MTPYLPDPVVRRLPMYYRYLREAERNGVPFLSSAELGQMAGLTASQVRQDVNAFGGQGIQGCGYPVKQLRQHVEKLLGAHRRHRMILMGAGNLGQALVQYSACGEGRFDIVAAFDTNVLKVGHPIGNLTIQHANDVEAFLQNHTVDIAILAIPAGAAQQAAHLLYHLGVRGFWNFAPVDLQLPSDAAMVNVHLDESLELLTFLLQKTGDKRVAR